MPNLATGFDLSDDKLTWTFHLRDGVKMQDGSAFTANDVKTAVDRVVGDADVHPPGELQVVRHRRHRDRSAHVAVQTNKPYATLVVDMSPRSPPTTTSTVGDAEVQDEPGGRRRRGSSCPRS